MKILLISSLFIQSVFAISSFNKIKTTEINNPALNTFVIIINGDSDRYRPESTHGSKTIRLDALDFKRVNKYAKKCKCNIIALHDQRGKSGLLKPRHKFGTNLSVYSNGKRVLLKRRFKFKSILRFKEIDLSSKKVLKSFYKFSLKTFPKSNFHIVYRGHSFNGENNEVSSHFDYSSKYTGFGIEKFSLAIEETFKKVKSVTFAACSMADIKIALRVSDYADKMIASQVNIPETGLTGFSFSFLEKTTDSSDTVELISQSLLENFESVEEKNLFLRETPLSVIDLRFLKQNKKELNSIFKKIDLSQEYKDRFLKTYPSKRYIDYRRSKGASEKVITMIKNKLFVSSLLPEIDLIEYLNEIGETKLSYSIQESIRLVNNVQWGHKNGLSLQILKDDSAKLD